MVSCCRCGSRFRRRLLSRLRPWSGVRRLRQKWTWNCRARRTARGVTPQISLTRRRRNRCLPPRNERTTIGSAGGLLTYSGTRLLGRNYDLWLRTYEASLELRGTRTHPRRCAAAFANFATAEPIVQTRHGFAWGYFPTCHHPTAGISRPVRKPAVGVRSTLNWWKPRTVRGVAPQSTLTPSTTNPCRVFAA